MSLAELIVITAKVAIIGGILQGAVPMMVWLERRAPALMQDRLGPNRVGPFGLFQAIVDAVKLITKEDLTPKSVSPFLYTLAPALAVIIALTTFIVIPFGDDQGLELLGTSINGFIAAPDLALGILYLFAIGSLGVYAMVLAGWASNNKYSQFGGIRAGAQMISYELAMTVSVVGVLMVAGSFKLNDIVAQQGIWNVFLQPIGALVFIVAMYAETNRAPFDLPEADAELIGGYHTEYSSMKFACFFMSEYIHMVVASCLAVLLFFGGWHMPGLGLLPEGWPLAIGSVVAFASKVAIFLWTFVWIRWTVPRFRFDQLMKLGWKAMVPLAILNFLWVGFAMAYGLPGFGG